VSDHLTEEEQLEAMKRWWNENGKWVVAAVVLSVGGYFGWGAWQDHQRAQAEAASQLYTELLDTLAVQESSDEPEEADLASAQGLVTELKNDYADTAYAANAALIRAGWAVEDGEPDLAEQQLRWVLKQKPDEPVAEIARLRLARVLLAKDDAEAALAQLAEDPPVASLKSDYAELRGDSHLALGETQAAREAYEEALNSLAGRQQTRHALLRGKLNNLPSNSSESAVEPEENAS